MATPYNITIGDIIIDEFEEACESLKPTPSALIELALVSFFGNTEDLVICPKCGAIVEVKAAIEIPGAIAILPCLSCGTTVYYDIIKDQIVLQDLNDETE